MNGQTEQEKVLFVQPGIANPPVQQRVYPVKPWQRFWARMMDIYLFFMIGSLLASAVIGFDYKGNLGLLLLTTLAWLLCYAVIDALLMAGLGTTAGKAVFRVVVRSASGGRLTFKEAWRRNLSMLYYGMGLQMPVIMLLCMSRAQYRLRTEGTTRWDKHRFTVVHGDHGLIRRFVCFLLIVGFIVLRVIDFSILPFRL
ncbi:RDD family protein [Paenibacillus sp. R14(2021)]|uniref:RDD family protein n=1 Tax=Paenibacillus sp. R14(2021) TaxID=2859228 RepID=UPI001C611F77|nr:RDD family protein [Paenibacillus sp. R14(2021)]